MMLIKWQKKLIFKALHTSGSLKQWFLTYEWQPKFWLRSHWNGSPRICQEKKRIFCYFSVNSNFLEAVAVLVVLPHYQFLSPTDSLIFSLFTFSEFQNLFQKYFNLLHAKCVFTPSVSVIFFVS